MPRVPMRVNIHRDIGTLQVSVESVLSTWPTTWLLSLVLYVKVLKIIYQAALNDIYNTSVEFAEYCRF